MTTWSRELKFYVTFISCQNRKWLLEFSVEQLDMTIILEYTCQKSEEIFQNKIGVGSWNGHVVFRGRVGKMT